MKLSLIVAASENNVIGKDGDLPWNLPDDLQYFKNTTKGYPIIMGRKNFESIGRVLPGRKNIIITRQSNYAVEGCDVVHSLEDAITIASATNAADEVFIIGGGEIYKQALPLVDTVYVTRVHAEIDGDVFFPKLGEQWQQVSAEHHEIDEQHKYSFTYFVYERAT